ncbi:MAG: TonB-dependent receptor [Rhodocyclales bacterium]|nr:TonB-dependent receptor [Rhodocyclales bacterium]
MARFAGLLALSAAWAAGGALAQQAPVAEASEHGYFEDLPVVLSVSRLAQPLNEVPGAVTVIDRDLIRRSGAREVAEVLRLVPGFLFTRRNGANPVATYHGALDIYGARMQVYVDGRSVYSSFYLGDTHRGLQGVVLEDIERIEVLRGSNSASYGANAFLGVVNIITRHAADSHGGMVSLTRGDKGIDDGVARVGWAAGDVNLRLTASHRRDRGLDRVHDDSLLAQAHLRADWNPRPSDEVRLNAGSMRGRFGEGARPAATNPGNIERMIEWEDVYVNASWRRDLGDGGGLALHASYERDGYADRFPYATIPTIAIDNGGIGDRMEIGFQHTLGLAVRDRLVWGIEWRRETAQSQSFFFSNATFSVNRFRGFLNYEWRPHPQVVVNAGGLYENHNIIGDSFAPRLTANLHVAADHTLRAGMTSASRAPGLYELRGDTRFFSGGVLADWTFRSSGKVKAERVLSQEVGYLGRFRSLGLTVDGRAFVERMNDRIRFSGRTGVGVPNDAVNAPGPHIHGFEYQFDWQPTTTTRILLAEAHLRAASGRADEIIEVPHRSTTLSFIQQLMRGVDLSLISHSTTPFSWSGTNNVLDTPRQLDARLAWAFAVGATRGEASVTVQAVNGGHQEYVRANRFERRAFATLRLDF